MSKSARTIHGTPVPIEDDDKFIPAILLSLVVAVFPHYLVISPGLSLLCLMLYLYRYLSVVKKWGPPSRFMKYALTGVGVCGILAQSGGAIDGNDYIAVLAVMAGLKPLEIKTHRDRVITVFLAYFIVIAALFIVESLAVTLYMFLSIWVSTAVLIRLNHPQGAFKAHMRQSLRIMLQAAPLMLVLFFFFPRLQGTFWGIVNRQAAQTGLAESIRFGDVSRLVTNNAVAFRAVFSDKVPPPPERYFRGIVFTRYRNQTWSREETTFRPLLKFSAEHPLSYRIVLEPHQRNWLFALDFPITVPINAHMGSGRTLISNDRVRKKIQYRLTSATTGRMVLPQNYLELEPCTVFPRDENPKTQALAASLWEKSKNKTAYIEAVLTYFKTNKFAYTLNPPILEGQKVDEFLFRTRKGFCEHYASAFAFLMRAAHIPARLVGGYLGGEINPYGQYLIIRQADAHVWVEVWDGGAWVRIDPTSVVAPERLSLGIANALPFNELPSFLRALGVGAERGLIKDLRLGWDFVNNSWDIWFSGYSFEEQKKIMMLMGIRVKSFQGMMRITGILIGVLLGVGGGIWAYYAGRGAEVRDPVQRAYLKFHRKLAKIGIYHSPSQGPMDLLRMAVAQRGDLKRELNGILNYYARIRYGKGTGARERRIFIRRVNEFRPIPKKYKKNL